MRSDRLLAILLTLQARGRVTAPELAEELEVSIRTVYRDVEALSSAGVPVYTEQGRGGGIALLAGYRTDATGLTADEARALFTFSGRGVLTDDTADERLRSAFRKLLVALPEEHREAAARAEERILVEPRPWMRKGAERVPALPLVQQAVLAGERLKMRYHASGRPEPGDYLVDPVGLVVKAGVWYLVGYRDGEPRMFRVGRIREAETAGTAQLPAGVPPLAELWDRMRTRFEQPGGGIRVTVVAAHDQAGWVIGACSGNLIDRPERSPSEDRPGQDELVLTFRSVRQAAHALAPLAEPAEVLDPSEVIEALVSLARTTVARYARTSPVTDSAR